MFTRKQRRSDKSGPYWKQRSWQLSAAFLTVVFLLGGFVALTSAPEANGDHTSAAAAGGPLTGASAMQNGRPQGCRTNDSAGDALPDAAPKDVTWRTLGVARVPVSASAGPVRTTGSLLWCFARTPMGAVQAAVIIPSQMSGSDWRSVTEQQVVAGHGRDLFEFQRSTIQDIDSADQSGGAAIASYAGFSVTSYTNAAATVRLLLRTDQGSAVTTIVVRWSGGDWKVLPNGDGSLHSPVSTVQGNTNGFILWST